MAGGARELGLIVVLIVAPLWVGGCDESGTASDGDGDVDGDGAGSAFGR